MYIQILQVCYFEQLSALMNKLQKKSYFESGKGGWIVEWRWCWGWKENKQKGMPWL